MGYVIYYSTYNHPCTYKSIMQMFFFGSNWSEFIAQQFKLVLMKASSILIGCSQAVNGYGFKQRNYLSDISHRKEDERLNNMNYES